MKLIKEKKIYTGDGMIENGYIRFDEKIEEVGDMTGFEPKEDDLAPASRHLGNDGGSGIYRYS